jgi:hypothetical protein
MTKTVSIVKVTRAVGPVKIVTADVDITSYTGSGEPLTASELGMKRLDSLMAAPNENYEHTAAYDYASGLVRVQTAGTEVVATTDVGVFRVVAIGV